MGLSDVFLWLVCIDCIYYSLGLSLNLIAGSLRVRHHLSGLLMYPALLECLAHLLNHFFVQ